MATTTLPTGPTVDYTDSGGDGPVIVLSHGFMLDQEMFDGQVPALVDAGWRVITWDQRGHGRTTYDARPYTYWDSAHDLLALLDHLGIEQAVVGGMSQGGFIALRVALEAPDRVVGLVFLDSQAGVEDPDLVPLYEGMAQSWVDDGPTEDLAYTVGGLILGPVGTDEFVAKWLARPATDIAVPFRTLMDRDDLTGRLGEITAPSIVIHGTDDPSIPVSRAVELANGLPGAGPVVLIEGGHHGANVSHPTEVNGAMLAFLGTLSPET